MDACLQVQLSELPLESTYSSSTRSSASNAGGSVCVMQLTQGGTLMTTSRGKFLSLQAANPGPHVRCSTTPLLLLVVASEVWHDVIYDEHTANRSLGELPVMQCDLSNLSRQYLLTNTLARKGLLKSLITWDTVWPAAEAYVAGPALVARTVVQGSTSHLLKKLYRFNQVVKHAEDSNIEPLPRQVLHTSSKVNYACGRMKTA
eukprot:5430284-Amphidinium_carterae.1